MSAPRNLVGLSKRQLEILSMVGFGLVPKEIAGALKTSHKAVEHHISMIRGRLNLRASYNAVDLARVAIGFGLTSLCLMLLAGNAAGAPVLYSPKALSLQPTRTRTYALTLSWNRVATNAVWTWPVTNYVLLRGTSSRHYSQTNEVGNVTQAQSAGLVQGTVYYFATQYRVGNARSSYGPELRYYWVAPNRASAPLAPRPTP